MKKSFLKLFTVIMVVSVLLCALTACDNTPQTHVCSHVCKICQKCTDADCTDEVCAEKCLGHSTATCSHVCPECGKCLSDDSTESCCTDKCPGHDFAGMLKLDLSSNTAKIVDAKVRTMNGKQIGLIDGDTTHFAIDKDNEYYSLFEDGILKARYNAINTPESTGTIEPWGQLASSFNKSKLKDAYSIVVESETSSWENDSTGSRYMVWIWYKETADSEYRNLNLEILQEGLAVASSIGQGGRYSDICWRALNYASAKGLYVHGMTDPDFYTGDVIPITLKALRSDLESFKNKTISVECTVAYIDGTSVYVEDYDAETGLYFGFPVFTGYNFQGQSMIDIGNRIRLVGKVSESDNYGWQIADLKYYAISKPGKIGCKLLSTGGTPSFQEISGTQFVGKDNVEIIIENDGVEESRKFDLAELINGATIGMNGLKVTRVYTTQSGSSAGAMTITCTTTDGKTVTVRTSVLTDADGNVVTQDYFEGKTINVKGVVDFYNDSYQIAVYNIAFITLVD